MSTDHQVNVQVVPEPGETDRGMRLRGRVVLHLVLIGLFVLVGRLVHLMVVRHDEFEGLAERQQYTRRVLPSTRGNIYDVRGRVLASSVASWSVWADPSAVQDKGATARALASVLGLSARDLAEKLRKDCLFVWVKRHLSQTETEAVRRLNLTGVELMKESRRVYPQGALGAEVIGFVDIDNRGIAGVEMKYNDALSGQDGFEVLRRDARRQKLSYYMQKRRAPVDGYHLLLTIDSYVQGVVEQELIATLDRHKARAVMAVVLDVNTGDVLALSAVPTFDPGAPGAAPESARRDRVIADCYEYGSVFKPLTVAGVLSAGLAQPTTAVDCENGAWKYKSRVVHDVHEYGTLSVQDVIAKSSNVGAAKLFLKLTPQQAFDWMRGYGLGERTGIDLPGEETGIVPAARQWRDHTVISVAFGQEVATTPIFIARAFAAIGNGGLLLRPRVVRAVASPDGSCLHLCRRSPEVIRRVMTEDVAAKMRAMMVESVETGTCTKLKTSEFPIAAKTGTAQIANRNGRGYAAGKYLSSLVAIAPADRPRIVVLVSVLEPSRGGYYGATVAGPACKTILSKTLLYLNSAPPEEPAARVDISNGRTGDEHES